MDKAQPCPRQKKYSTKEFMKDLLLNDIDDLNLEHMCDVGFQNLFRVNNSGFENILNMIALIIIKQDTKFRPAIPVNRNSAFFGNLRFLRIIESPLKICQRK